MSQARAASVLDGALSFGSPHLARAALLPRSLSCFFVSFAADAFPADRPNSRKYSETTGCTGVFFSMLNRYAQQVCAVYERNAIAVSKNFALFFGPASVL